jgi:hypothetical protein
MATKKPSRLTLKRALTTGEIKIGSMACIVALEGLHREGHEVYVLPRGAGGTSWPAYLVVELQGPSAVDPQEFCPDAFVVRDGILRLVSFDHEYFRRQDIRWDRRRWVGHVGSGSRAIQAPGVEVTLYPRGPGPDGPMVYWSASQGPAESSYGSDPLRGHWMIEQLRHPWGETRGYLSVSTGRGFPHEHPSAWGSERVAQHEAFARQALSEAIAMGWAGLPR